MADMNSKREAEAEQRLALLDAIARICERAAMPIARGRIQLPGPAAGSSVRLGGWDATVVRAQNVRVGHQIPSRPWRRAPPTGSGLICYGQRAWRLLDS